VFFIREDTERRFTEDGNAEIMARAKAMPKSVNNTLSDMISTVDIKSNRVEAEDDAAALLPPDICKAVITGMSEAK